jgi:plastocyanin
MSTFPARALVALALTVPFLLGAPAARATTHLIEIADGAFVPSVLTVEAGDLLRVVNRDGVPHTFTADDRSYDSGRLMHGDSTQIVLSATGIHGFRCSLGGQQVRVHVEVGRGAVRRATGSLVAAPLPGATHRAATGPLATDPYAAPMVMHRSGR